jgi:fibronectin-binding autotransporter adhesin
MVADNTNGIVTTISGPLEFDGSPSSGGDFVGPTSSGYLNVTGPLTNTVTGDISSRLGLVRYSGGGSYTTFTLNAGTASLGANNGLCTNASLTVGSSGAAIFDLNGFSQALAGLTDGAANAELVTNSGATLGTLTLNLSAANTYSGVIAGNFALVENGSGSLYLAGTNAYTGNTTLSGGTLELAQPGLAPQSTITVASGAVLQLDFAVTNQVFAFITNGISAAAGVYGGANAAPYLTGSGYLLVLPGPSAPAHLTNSIAGSTLSLSWPAGMGWRLVCQTNSLSIGLNPNPAAWTTVPVLTDGSASLTVDPSRPSVFYRLVYP